MFVCHCIHCGKEIEVPKYAFIEESESRSAYYDYLRSFEEEQSNKCKCQSIKVGDLVQLKECTNGCVGFKITQIDKLMDITYITGETEDGEYVYCTLEEIRIPE